jgi:hypothetical protein
VPVAVVLFVDHSHGQKTSDLPLFNVAMDRSISANGKPSNNAVLTALIHTIGILVNLYQWSSEII